jgi:hypothetical protein
MLVWDCNKLNKWKAAITDDDDDDDDDDEHRGIFHEPIVLIIINIIFS